MQCAIESGLLDHPVYTQLIYEEKGIAGIKISSYFVDQSDALATIS